jgi:hypothetical protein
MDKSGIPEQPVLTSLSEIINTDKLAETADHITNISWSGSIGVYAKLLTCGRVRMKMRISFPKTVLQQWRHVHRFSTWTNSPHHQSRNHYVKSRQRPLVKALEL